ncbi:mechanosensitive ion channel family protein [Haliea sp. AH-315-K21]|nr:mechanosensitive ion channel family protein [Haliea sp. AH-315-K21]MBN4075167.1 mechanosensitive ion channel family protein [Gammaproteobacteria bacterium AH-315-E17]
MFSWLDIGNNTWIVQVFIVVLATVILNLIMRVVLKKTHEKLTLTENVWDDAVLIAARKPLALLVWVIGLSIAAEIVQGVTANELFEYTPLVRRIAIILLLMMFLTKLIKNIEKNILHKTKKSEIEADEITVRVLARLLRLSVLITTGLVILQTLGISVTGVVAFGGIGGIAIGFAAQDLLANFFGGLIIYLDRPFTVGDWIRSPDREIEGTVEDIGWRLTIIRTFDKRPLYIPNSIFTKISVENPSRMLNRRIYETIGLRYSDAAKVREIIEAVKKMLINHEEIDTNTTLIVNFNAMAASSLDFFIYTFTKTTDWVHYHEVKQDILLLIIDIVHEHGADIAFPTTTLDGSLVIKKLENANV